VRSPLKALRGARDVPSKEVCLKKIPDVRQTDQKSPAMIRAIVL
jgi:hypothetical protein